MIQSAKKLAAVLMSFILIIETYKKAYIFSAIKNTFLLNIFWLKYMLCIYYLMQFKKNQVKVQVFLNFGSEVNIIILAYATKLGLKVQLINIGT